MRGAPLHLVQILPLGIFHAPLADPSRKWEGVGAISSATPSAEPKLVPRLRAQIKEGSLSLAWGRVGLLCETRETWLIGQLVTLVQMPV